MMRPIPLWLCLLVAGAALANGQSQADLRKWVGRYPNSPDDPTVTPPSGGNLFRVPQVRDQLKQLLRPWDRRRLTVDYSAQSRVGLAADTYLLVDVCKPQHCAAERAMMVINLDTGRIVVGFWNGSERWFPADGKEIPALIRLRLRPSN